ncbi:hypothetical protein [Parasphingorhabdus sp.]|uniref:hypothetical protein n=1 Tax=Parasphingorhabdus sp. TaxID=2709688 RepID=UPI00326411AC
MARFKQPAMAVAGGIAAALVIATLPHVYLENAVGATGLSEIIPAAAPPLGNTARGLIALAAGLVSASAIYMFLNHKPKFLGGGSDMGFAIHNDITADSIDSDREEKRGFTMPKLNLSAKSLTKFLKKPKKSPGQVTELQDLPDVRSVDRHPDAPARQPIFASSDLGEPLAQKIQRFEEPDVEDDVTDTAEQPASLDVTPIPFAVEEIPEPLSEEEPALVRVENILQEEEPIAPSEDLSGLSLAQLADRLESGLRRLEALELGNRTTASPAVAQSEPKAEAVVSSVGHDKLSEAVVNPQSAATDETEIDALENRQADMDAALKAALGTLEKMTTDR